MMGIPRFARFRKLRIEPRALLVLGVIAGLVDVRSLSFPSGNAMLSAVAYLTLAVLLAKTQKERRVRVFVMTAGLFMTLVVGISRVYLAVHWPTDVLGGWTAGSIWMLDVWLVARRLDENGVMSASSIKKQQNE